MSKRRYARTARLNELLREIIAEELERLGDERLELVTISGVEVDAGLDQAVVYFSTLAPDDDDAEVLEAFEEARRGLQSAVGRQARTHSTPRLVFRADHGIRTGARVDEILRELRSSGAITDDPPPVDDPADGPVEEAVDGGPVDDEPTGP